MGVGISTHLANSAKSLPLGGFSGWLLQKVMQNVVHLMELVVAESLCIVARLAFGALFLRLGVRLLRAGLSVRSRRTFLKHIRLELFTLKASALMPKWTRSAAVKFDEARCRAAGFQTGSGGAASDRCLRLRLRCALPSGIVESQNETTLAAG